MEGQENHRCRMNFSMSSKGLWQIDVTAEYDTPERSAEEAEKAIAEALKVAEKKGLVLASQV